MNVQPSFDIASLVGQTLDGKVRLESILGRGGMGAVYRGKHLLLGRPVAVKVLRPEFVADENASERFFREARTAAALDHPNVITVFDFGLMPTGGAYLVLELIDGILLRTLVRQEGSISPKLALPILREVCAAVEAAHRKGVIHRDLKPENIMLKRLDEGGAIIKVLDFGLAKVIEAAEAGANLTQTGELVGTPTYMSPEHCDGTDLDARSDIYSLGVIAYELLTGNPPFRGRIASILTGHMQKEPPPLRNANPDIPLEIESAVLNALEKRRGDRPASVRHFWDCLEDAYVASFGEGSPAKISLTLPALKDSSQDHPTLLEDNPSSSFTGIPPYGQKVKSDAEEEGKATKTPPSVASDVAPAAETTVVFATQVTDPALFGMEARETVFSTHRSLSGGGRDTLYPPLTETIATSTKKRRRAYIVAGFSILALSGAAAVGLALQAPRSAPSSAPSVQSPPPQLPAAVIPSTTTVVPAGTPPVIINIGPPPAPPTRRPSANQTQNAAPRASPKIEPPRNVERKPNPPPTSSPEPKLESSPAPAPSKPTSARESKTEPESRPEARNETGGLKRKVGDGAKKTFQGMKKFFGAGKDKKETVRNER